MAGPIHRDRRYKNTELAVRRLRLTTASNQNAGYIEVDSSGNPRLFGSAGSGIPSQEYQLSGPAKAGATAGWVVAAGANLYEATLPQSQTASTLVIPIRGLKVGWTITGFKVHAQIESGGNTVTLDADLRKLTTAAADPADASIGAITQVSVTADTAVAAEKTGLSEVIAATEWPYLLVTATTGASCDIRLLGATVTVTETSA